MLGDTIALGSCLRERILLETEEKKARHRLSPLTIQMLPILKLLSQMKAKG